jgi:hypothetical protein
MDNHGSERTDDPVSKHVAGDTDDGTDGSRNQNRDGGAHRGAGDKVAAAGHPECKRRRQPIGHFRRVLPAAAFIRADPPECVYDALGPQCRRRPDPRLRKLAYERDPRGGYSGARP